MQLLPYIAAVVDEAGKVATLGSVYNRIVINTEHIAATDSLFLVALLSHISNHLTGHQCIYLETYNLTLKVHLRQIWDNMLV